MNRDRIMGWFDWVLLKGPYIIIWFVVLTVTMSIATQIYMWNQRRAYVGPERDSVLVAGGGQQAAD